MVLSLYFFVAFADSFVFRQGYLFNYAGKVLQCFLRGRRIWRGWGWWIRGCSWLGYGRRLIAGGDGRSLLGCCCGRFWGCGYPNFLANAEQNSFQAVHLLQAFYCGIASLAYRREGIICLNAVANPAKWWGWHTTLFSWFSSR